MREPQDSVFRAFMPMVCLAWFFALVAAWIAPGGIAFCFLAFGVVYAAVGILFDWRGWS